MPYSLFPEVEREATARASANLGVGDPSAFAGFAKGSGMYTMRGFAETARAIDLIGAVGPIVLDKLTGGNERQDEYFREHEEVFQNAVDYWTPKPGEVGAAGQIVGGLAGALPLIIANPALGVAAAQLSAGEELTRQGVSAGVAEAVGAIQGASLAVGIRLPYLGRTLASRVVSGGLGNLAQGTVGAAGSRIVLKGAGFPEQGEQFDPFDPTQRSLDLLMGAAFGGLAHKSIKEQMARDAVWNDSAKDALLTLNQAKHLESVATPGEALPFELTQGVKAVQTAMDQLLRGEPVNVEKITQGAKVTPDAAYVQAQAEEASVAAKAAAEIMPDALAPIEAPSIIAYHGSPHDFEKFDISKIGTGEGAQAFGHGLYFAESPKVAEGYQKGVTGRQAYTAGTSPTDVEGLAGWHEFSNGSRRAAIDNLTGHLNGELAKPSPNIEWIAKTKEVIARLENPAPLEAPDSVKGQLYKVSIPKSVVDNMLDWDVKIKDQPQAVQDAVHKLLAPYIQKGRISTAPSGAYWVDQPNIFGGRTGFSEIGREAAEKAAAYDPIMDATGKEVKEALSKFISKQTGADMVLGTNQGPAEAALKQVGIGGIKYLDQGSRAEGEGTRNFVLFDPEHATITEKNGKPVTKEIRDQFIKDNTPEAKAEPAKSAEPAKPIDPIVDTANRIALERPDMRVPTGELDAQGNAVSMTAAEYMAKAAETSQAQQADAGLFRTAITCLLGVL